MIDLDSKKAARREAKGEGPKVTVGGETYELAVEMPFGVIEAMSGLHDEETAATAIVDIARSLLGEHYETIKPHLSMEDVNELIGSIMGEYGVEAPLPSAAS